MKQRLTLVTLGVGDLARARRFYEDLGWRSNTAPELDVAFFQAGGMALALWDREKVAADAGLELGHGFGAVSLAHNVATELEVDEVIAEAAAAGATITREPGATFWGGYAGVFVDPDGHPWEVAHNPGWTLAEDGSVTLPD
jgi:uncharacterized glyoxalase superfamily protein PhnB